MTDGGEPVSVPHRGEAAQAAPGDVGEEDPLDRVLVAEGQDLVAIRPLDQPHGWRPLRGLAV
jgi:hypothetical protein